MRIGVISDIHGNLTALQAVLKDLEERRVDEIICLGDIVTLGPLPKETFALLQESGCSFIKGNHEGALLDPENSEEFEITSHLIPDLYWCREQLSLPDLKKIEAFPATLTRTLPNGVRVLFFHGSPHSPTHLIQAHTAPAQLEAYIGGFEADVFVGGHSHIQMYRRHGDKLILNSGSVGNAFHFTYSPGNPPSLLPWSEYLVLSQSGNALDVDLRRVYFDTNELRGVLKGSSLPGVEWWLRQYPGDE